jgi:hypothetical protein
MRRPSARLGQESMLETDEGNVELCCQAYEGGRRRWLWRSQPAGLMFWLSRKRFVGSYFCFTATSRAYLVGL